MDAHTPYAEDVAAQLFVEAFPNGATLREVAEALGITRKRVRQIEIEAVRRAWTGLRAAGVTADDVRRLVASTDGAEAIVALMNRDRSVAFRSKLKFQRCASEKPRHPGELDENAAVRFCLQ